MTRRGADFAVIMAGGQGTRFWPWSRRKRPKQLLPIAGRRTLLQETVGRLRGLVSLKRTLVVTGAAHAAAVRRQLPSLSPANLIVEPAGRNTAPCIGLAAAAIAARSRDGAMLVLPADHNIADAPGFRAAAARALEIARRQDCLVTLGVRPTYAETGYGYIEVGAELDGGAPRAFDVRRFHEKPERRVAERYVSGGGYLWNAGMFAWRVEVIDAALRRYLPEVAAALAPVRAAAGEGARRRAVRRAYAAIASISIDKGVMERTEGVAVVEADFGWSDVGSWDAMPAVWGTDASGNALRGEVVAIDSTGSVVRGGRRMVALLGVRDLVVVDTDDAILVCRRENAQEVRRVVEELARRKRLDLL